MGNCIRLLIADDHPYSRKGLRALLSTYPTVDIVCEAEDGLEAVQLVEDCQPDVVLMDIQMPRCDGLEATRHIKARTPEVKVIVLTIRESSRAAALSAGADGFLLKGCPSAELLAAIHCHGTSQGENETPVERAQGDVSAPKRVGHQRKQLATSVSIT